MATIRKAPILNGNNKRVAPLPLQPLLQPNKKPNTTATPTPVPTPKPVPTPVVAPAPVPEVVQDEQSQEIPPLESDTAPENTEMTEGADDGGAAAVEVVESTEPEDVQSQQAEQDPTIFYEDQATYVMNEGEGEGAVVTATEEVGESTTETQAQNGDANMEESFPVLPPPRENEENETTATTTTEEPQQQQEDQPIQLTEEQENAQNGTSDLNTYHPGLEEQKKRTEENKAKALAILEEKKKEKERLENMDLGQRIVELGMFSWRKIQKSLHNALFVYHQYTAGYNRNKSTRRIVIPGFDTFDLNMQTPVMCISAGPILPFGSYHDYRHKTKYIDKEKETLSLSYLKLENAQYEVKLSNEGIPGVTRNISVRMRTKKVNPKTKKLMGYVDEDKLINLDAVDYFVTCAKIELLTVIHMLDATDIKSVFDDQVKLARKTQIEVDKASGMTMAKYLELTGDAKRDYDQKIVMRYLTTKTAHNSQIWHVDADAREEKSWTDDPEDFKKGLYCKTYTSEVFRHLNPKEAVNPDDLKIPLLRELLALHTAQDDGTLLHTPMVWNRPNIISSGGQLLDPITTQFNYKDGGYIHEVIKPNPYKKLVGLGYKVEFLTLTLHKRSAALVRIDPVEEALRVVKGLRGGLIEPVHRSTIFNLQEFHHKLLKEEESYNPDMAAGGKYDHISALLNNSQLLLEEPGPAPPAPSVMTIEVMNE